VVGFLPGLIGGELSGAATSMVIMPMDLSLEELVGGGKVGDFFIGQEGDEAFLKDLETAFDFAFGLGIGSDAVVDAQSGEGALELGMGVQTVGGGAMSKQRKAIGVEAGWQAILFE